MLRFAACLLAAILYAPAVDGLRVGPALSTRRGVLLGAATLGAVPLPALAKLEGDELQGVLSRAASGKLDISKLIERAKKNDLIDPKDIPQCDGLVNVRAFDEKAVQQLLVQKRDMGKQIKAAKKDETYTEEMGKEFTELVTVLSRIEAQVTRINEAEGTRMCNGGY